MRSLDTIGWPFLILAAGILAAVAGPPLIRYIRFEHQLSKRVRRYEERAEAARVERVRYPKVVDLVDDMYDRGDLLGLHMMATAMEATEKALARELDVDVVPLEQHSVRAAE